jgi:FkbM family methyltransferase
MTEALREVGGWWLPPKDGYFDRYVEGSHRKQNGFQREHLEEAFKHVRAWNVAVDVGAHIGFWTVPMAQRFKRVYAFEPAEDCFSCLEKNVLGQPATVILQNVAVGDKAGTVHLYDDVERIKAGKPNTGARFVTPSMAGKIPMIALDSLKLDACDLLKVDVEGFESMVLRGAKDTIAKFQPVISMETDKKFSQPRYGIANTEAEHFLLKRGYSVVAHMRPDKVFAPA